MVTQYNEESAAPIVKTGIQVIRKMRFKTIKLQSVLIKSKTGFTSFVFIKMKTVLSFYLILVLYKGERKITTGKKRTKIQ
jgi:hypothetical protein